MIKTINANAVHIPLRDKSVHCVFTSPPYWGLRDYGANGQFGMESTPEEYVDNLVMVFREVWRVLRDDGVVWLNLGDSYAGSGGAGGDYAEGGLRAGQPKYGGTGKLLRDAAARIGERSTLEGGQANQMEGAKMPGRRGVHRSFRCDKADVTSRKYGQPATGVLKPKDLVGIPWMVAFALRADGAASPAHMLDVERMIAAITDSYESRDEWPDLIAAEVERLEREHVDANRGGWYLRSDTIWHKPNPMPESVLDRPTRSHEYVFLLTKSPRYFYDAHAIMERAAYDGRKDTTIKPAEKYNGRQMIDGQHHNQANQTERPTLSLEDGSRARNKRTVWTIPTQPYSGAHFATFPEALSEIGVLAGTSDRGCCPQCGTPWVRVLQKPDMKDRPTRGQDSKTENEASIHISNGWEGYPKSAGQEYQDWRPANPDVTLRWDPGCMCEPPEGDAYEPVPCTVLDPFAGSATVGKVCGKHRRNFIGLELNFKYIGLARERTAEIQQNMFMG